MSETSLTRKVALNASALAAGRMAAAALGIVSVGISTRYLGLDAYGQLVTALAFATLVGLLTDIGIWNIGAREIAKRPEETQRIVSGLLTAGLAISLLAAAVGVIAAVTIYGGNDDELVHRAILLLMTTAPLAAPSGAVSAYFIARQKPYMGMIASVIGSVVMLVMLVVVTTLDWGFTGVVLAYVSAAIVQSAVVVALSVGKISLRPGFDLALTGQLMRWALPLGGAMLIGALYWRIDIILLSLLSSDAEVGLYGLAYKIVDALVVLPTFVTITLLPEFARLSGAQERFDQIVQTAFSVLQIAALAVFVPFVVFADEITELVGGSDFSEAAPVLRLLMVAVALTYLSVIFAQAIIALNGQSKLFRLSLLLLPANVAFNLALIPVWGASGAALAFALTEVIHLAVIVTLYRGFARLPRPWKVGRVLAAGAAMAGAALVKLLPASGEGGLLLVLLLGGTLSLVLYVASLYALKAMPRELHTNLVLPLWTRLRLAHSARTGSQ